MPFDFGKAAVPSEHIQTTFSVPILWYVLPVACGLHVCSFFAIRLQVHGRRVATMYIIILAKLSAALQLPSNVDPR